ncbi:hypothetical protein NDU88_002292 [Pleurodeles waltl]|uniref:Cyclic nucleotide-binding domain-containing protein n=1 Tax=Pleurodeles waltl TaxID=8319 RepID=A0AAV7U912_PLEWA|nr:hypothetical protein NDU88_002292 [Pleurodeles waltl]
MSGPTPYEVAKNQDLQDLDSCSMFMLSSGNGCVTGDTGPVDPGDTLYLIKSGRLAIARLPLGMGVFAGNCLFSSWGRQHMGGRWRRDGVLR